MSLPHPLEQLQPAEILLARDVIRAANKGCLINFRTISLQEPAKSSLKPFLDAEHSGRLTAASPRPAREARAAYDLFKADKSVEYTECVVDIGKREVVACKVLTDPSSQPQVSFEEFKMFKEIAFASPMFQEELSKIKLPDGYALEIDTWPYGGPNADEKIPRYMQGLCFARKIASPESNYYGFPVPLVPVMDVRKKEIVRVDKIATGGDGDGFAIATGSNEPVAHMKPSEYVPELMDIPLRKDLKPLNVIQPEGPSFKVTDDSLVEWQKWRFRVGFNEREGATIHDVMYDGRQVLYRLSMSEMTVPYADPRPPWHRKQAFDFGDADAGRHSNNLALGCDCLGVIKYLDTTFIQGNGELTPHKNCVCMHEQDYGIGWKHTNTHTGRAVGTRYREFVVQFILTLANYEYIFMFKFDQAGGITLETRATGIVSVVNIDPGKQSAYGNVVAPGVLAQNHQHMFCARIDPAIDGWDNTALREESLPRAMNPENNPFGNAYDLVTTPITKTTGFDASPQTNLVVRLANEKKLNKVSGRPVSYKLTPPPTQLLLADPNSIQARRAQFAQHHVWLTKYKDNELYAGGRYTNQSQDERGGVADAAKRDEDIRDSDVVLWSTFGITHNPRVEDWPVMPIERLELCLRPYDFFEVNPAIDVPGDRNLTSVQVEGEKSRAGAGGACCGGKGEEKQSKL